MEVPKNHHAPNSAIGTRVKFQFNWENLFSKEIIFLKRWFCGQFYLNWWKIKNYNFRKPRYTESGLCSVPVDLRFCILTEVLCDHLGYRWTLYCPFKTAVFQVKYDSTVCGQNFSQKMRYGDFGWTVMKRIFWFALKNGSFKRQLLSGEIPPFQIGFRGSNSFGKRRCWTTFLQKITKKTFRVFLTWKDDIVEIENGRTIFSREGLTFEFVLSQNVNTWRLIIHPTKEGYFVCQMSHWSPKCASMHQC